MTSAVVAAKLLAGAAVATAGVAVASTGGVAGIQNALAHVPTWTHAHSVLEAILAAFQSGKSPGPHPGRA
jgi:hypothetical protein